MTFAPAFAAAIAVFYVGRNIHVFSLVHRILWTPLLVSLYRRELRSGNSCFAAPCGMWLLLLCATMVVFLLFDVRDALLVLTGRK